MTKLNLRVWPYRGIAHEWSVQYRPKWSPFWCTVGIYQTVEEARQVIEELEKTE